MPKIQFKKIFVYYVFRITLAAWQTKNELHEHTKPLHLYIEKQ